jgi:chaperone required for assembly of F1-ATPase
MSTDDSENSGGYARGVKGEIDQRPKRFYAEVQVVGEGANWAVHLDHRALRTHGKKQLVLPTQALANVIADEWRGQGERIDLQSMFNTRLAYMALDRTPVARGELVKETARYAATDLVCHLADGPAVLRARQDAAWGSMRDWVAKELGVHLKAVEGIIPIAQPEASIEAVRHHASGLEDFRLSALSHAVSLLGSAVLGLAVERRFISAAEAFEMSRIDEAYQAEKWGEDHEATIRTERTRAEARALDLWFDALGPTI